jgi:N-acetyltransferase
MRTALGNYEIDDDPARIDTDAAAAFLTTSVYWATWRTTADVKAQLASAWRLVGAYDADGQMVGLARAFSDEATAYLADVYVQPDHQGVGLGKALTRVMIEEGPGAGYRWMLHTSDAHGLYRQFGFAAPDGRYMERPRDKTSTADPLDTGPLTGTKVRLEPLSHGHVPALWVAAADGGELYQWTAMPKDEDGMRQYVEAALSLRDRAAAVPYAVVRLAEETVPAEETVIGSTRFHQLDYWAWPDAPAGPRAPDVVEIGWTWLSPRAIRTGVNTEMKRLMLTHAFETWRVQCVCLHTDARNERSRAAMERIGCVFEGVLRAHRLAADLAPRDSARYSVTTDDWPAVKQRLADLDERYLTR